MDNNKISSILKSVDNDLQLLSTGNISHKVPGIRQCLRYIVSYLEKLNDVDFILIASAEAVNLTVEQIKDTNRRERSVFGRALFVVYCVENKLLDMGAAMEIINRSKCDFYNNQKIIAQARANGYENGTIWLEKFNKIIKDE